MAQSSIYVWVLMLSGKVSVVMPAFNESQHIVRNIQEVVDTLSDFDFDFEVIVVDDGSPDNTYLHAARVLLKHPELVRIVRYDKNQGKGNAVMCGASYSRGDYIVFLDADMDLHPEQLPLFFQMLESERVDAVIGSKWHGLSRVNYPFIRKIYSRGYYALIRLLFGLPIRDTQTGMKVFRADLLRRVFPYILVKRFAFDIEMLALAHHWNYKIIDAPVSLDFRRSIGRVSWKHALAVLQDTLAIFYRLRILRYYDRMEAVEVNHGAREITVADATTLDLV